MLLPGDPAPSFKAVNRHNPSFVFDSVAGRFICVTFIEHADAPGMAQLLDAHHADGGLLDDERACAFIVTHDDIGSTNPRLNDRFPGIRVFFDPKRAIAPLFGVIPVADGGKALGAGTWILDGGLRARAVIQLRDPATHMDMVWTQLRALLAEPPKRDAWAPVLEIPHVLEPHLCKAYLDYANGQGFHDSGFMRTEQVTGQTVLMVDHSFKRRSDCTIEDDMLRTALQQRIHRRIKPAIERAFQFNANRLERYLIARYDANEAGHFRPHRDNTTLGTAHRRFAVTMNLNAEEYDGGDLRFPEFGMRTYRAPTGGAIVFACSLLHEATPVTRGTRFAILPFLYDDAAAEVRRKNAEFIADPELRANVIRSIG